MSDHKPLDIDKIENARSHSRIGRKVVVFKSTRSTNDIAWKYAGSPEYHGLCVLAESQTAGRGRRGRTWHSEPGESILCSVLLLNQSIGAELPALAAAVATAEAIDAAYGLDCRIKWPNDVLIDGKKVAGILVEQRTANGCARYVIGIGINCNQTAAFFDACTLNYPATSLRLETGRTIDRSSLVEELLNQLEYWLDKDARAGTARPAGFGAGMADPMESPVIARWHERSGMLGRHMEVECDGKRYRGTCRGIDPAEGLILQLDGGAIRFFNARQTSLCL